VAAVKVGQSSLNKSQRTSRLNSCALVDADGSIDETVDITGLEGGSAGIVHQSKLTVVADHVKAAITRRRKVVEELIIEAGSLVVEGGGVKRRPERVAENASGTEILAIRVDAVAFDSLSGGNGEAALETVDINVKGGAVERVLGMQGHFNLAKPRRILGAAPNVAEHVATAAVRVGDGDPHTRGGKGRGSGNIDDDADRGHARRLVRVEEMLPVAGKIVQRARCRGLHGERLNGRGSRGESGHGLFGNNQVKSDSDERVVLGGDVVRVGLDFEGRRDRIVFGREGEGKVGGGIRIVKDLKVGVWIVENVIVEHDEPRRVFGPFARAVDEGARADNVVQRIGLQEQMVRRSLDGCRMTLLELAT